MFQPLTPDTLLTQLIFPLNAFACATFLEEGQVDYLHYGLFDQDHTSLHAAQNQSTELIIARLPPQGSSILEIGIGLGTTAKRLVECGYQVTGIAPDPAQVAIARRNTSGMAHFETMKFEHFDAAAQSFDLILFQESSQYIDPTILFSKSRNLLKPGGRVLILDQVALRRLNPLESLLPFTQDFIQHAVKQGYQLREYLDLSNEASPTLDYILKILDAHGNALLTLLPHSKDEISALRSAVAANRSRYLQGLLGYALFNFQL